MKTALVAGATGLVGHELVKGLLDRPEYNTIKILVRSTFDLQHPKLQVIKSDFNELSSLGLALAADDVFCCLGTTMAKAKTKEAFRRVDYEYPVALAKGARTKGTKKYLLVSAMGANRGSAFFYNQVKGATEDAIRALGFDALHIFRPSLLLGHRHESRPGEDAAKMLYRLIPFLIPSKYKGIDAAKVAQAMIHFANTPEKGIFIHESKELQRF